MGQRGPQAAPVKLQLLRGDPQKKGKKKLQKQLEDQPQLPICLPDCPDYVKADPVAEKAWNEYGGLLVRMRLMTEADTLVLANLAIAHAAMLAHIEAVRKLNTQSKSGIQGYVIQTQSGYLAKNQIFSNLENVQSQILRLCGELGLSISARQRMKVEPDPKTEENPWKSL